MISDITGRTGDDIVALTAGAPDDGLKGGSLNSTHVMGHDWTRRESGIHDIVIRNIVGYSNLCYNVRLLACNTHIYNVVIDGVIDVPAPGIEHTAAINIGDPDNCYGVNLPDGIKNITVSNVVSYGRYAIVIRGYLRDSVISNVINNNPACEGVTVKRENGVVNVQMNNIVSVSAGK